MCFYKRLSHAPFIHQVRIVEEDRASEDSSEVLLDEELLQYYAYLAEKGDLTSQVNLAQLLLQRGFDDDVNKAAKLFQLAGKETNYRRIMMRFYLVINFLIRFVFIRKISRGRSCARLGLFRPNVLRGSWSEAR